MSDMLSDLESVVGRYEGGKVVKIIERVNHLCFAYESQPT